MTIIMKAIKRYNNDDNNSNDDDYNTVIMMKYIKAYSSYFRESNL